VNILCQRKNKTFNLHYYKVLQLPTSFYPVSNCAGELIQTFFTPFHPRQASAPSLAHLKVPKREIFDRSDFPDFYTMKSLRVGDFGVKIKYIFKNI
jgi:hypothetical protein